MVKITIIGWYGTETIGDRAILAGLISLFREAIGDFEIKLGSIYPFFTERTLYEDMDFLCRCAKKQRLHISLFDSRDVKELDNAIGYCDMLVMGGGPLMGMACMFMVEYAFAKAKKLHKKTMVLGCGVGPMRKRIYERSLVHIVRKADVTVFRDDTSLREYNRIAGRQGNGKALIDPAVFAAVCFKEINTSKPDDSIADTIAVSVREFPDAYKINKSIQSQDINRLVITFIKNLLSHNKPVHLVPMHYFGVGYDDRVFMNMARNTIGSGAVSVQNKPLTLYETMKKFADASLCVGMRFHSVVLQTLLNGNNIILDYTDPKTGKIGNFIRQMGAEEQYKNSYIALQTTGNKLPELHPEKLFKYDGKRITMFRDTYITTMRSVI
jgi:polysaccharide pyruvyl transferase WcaK-like protein